MNTDAKNLEASENHLDTITQLFNKFSMTFFSELEECFRESFRNTFRNISRDAPAIFQKILRKILQNLVQKILEHFKLLPAVISSDYSEKKNPSVYPRISSRCFFHRSYSSYTTNIYSRVFGKK